MMDACFCLRLTIHFYMYVLSFFFNFYISYNYPAALSTRLLKQDKERGWC